VPAWRQRKVDRSIVSKIILPEILNIPPKLLPIITDFNDYSFFLLEGGRGGGKTHSVARFLLYLGEQRKIRIFCGREYEIDIKDSVFTTLTDHIDLFNLAYDIKAETITHKWSGTTFRFKAFREHGNVRLKGLEGVDILWVDEAETLTEDTVSVLMPTLRKQNVKAFFTMNRFLRNDAVPEYCIGLRECLHIKINYNENPFCTESLKRQAEAAKKKSERDYNHVWLGEPLQQSDAYVFNFHKLHKAFTIEPFGETPFKQRVIGIDFAAQGNDMCVATVLDRITNQHWEVTERIVWDESDTTVSIGKIVNILGEFNPDVTVFDIGGLGKPVWDSLQKMSLNITPFNGGWTKDVGLDAKNYANLRAQSFYKLKEWFECGFLIINQRDKQIIKELEKIKMKYRANGVRVIQSKGDMKTDLRYSPDNADSLMMAVYGATAHLGRAANTLVARRTITRIDRGGRRNGKRLY